MLLTPIQGTLAMKFWASANICNRVRAICAYSKDAVDANKNLTRFGYPNSFRKRVIKSDGVVFNTPTMDGIPFNKGNTPIWECLNQKPKPGSFTVWDDKLNWLDTNTWKEWVEAPSPTFLEGGE